ncbi:tetratricopeptide repeat protein [Nostoc sp. CHAB 5824]|nr:tetratricopeptide repeat protein [Nostoc sp. CHAB 5824]
MDFTSKTNQAWDLTLEGEYPEAIKLYREILNEKKTLGELDNYGITLLCSGNFEEAESVFLEAREDHRFRLVVHPFLGTAIWLQGRQQEACEYWHRETERLFTREVTHYDETGKVPTLLWWASCHQDLQQWQTVAEKALKRLWRTNRTRESIWPGTIVAYLLEKVNVHKLFWNALDTKYPRAETRNKLKAHFYYGAMLLNQGDIKGYQEELMSIAALPKQDLITQPEYHLAMAELKS